MENMQNLKPNKKQNMDIHFKKSIVRAATMSAVRWSGSSVAGLWLELQGVAEFMWLWIRSFPNWAGIHDPRVSHSNRRSFHRFI